MAATGAATATGAGPDTAWILREAPALAAVIEPAGDQGSDRAVRMAVSAVTERLAVLERLVERLALELGEVGHAGAADDAHEEVDHSEQATERSETLADVRGLLGDVRLRALRDGHQAGVFEHSGALHQPKDLQPLPLQMP